ncbi:hypothetical protein RhiXN_02487 [Rhizoctonia solani]|uniref:Uncharacterized protein n=1 Tax=Rhizoctonia solani TaxID=456999 RepID=A0A8H8SUX7_9AGAM|nr:uncharacterized protein RhiXN_02487 [Rhizoctonia solani]QRW17563.1 hypothetical protein RhiXN_02487 [Rhizoctonia solani]
MEPKLLAAPAVHNKYGQLDHLEQKFGKQAEAIKETRSIVEGISQTIDGLEARVSQAPQPSTPEDWKPPAVKETP